LRDAGSVALAVKSSSHSLAHEEEKRSRIFETL
jgi:hypothetical protein